MSKLKEIERLEKSEQRLMTLATITVVPLGVIALVVPMIVSLKTGILFPFWATFSFMLPAIFAAFLFMRRSLKNCNKLTQLRKEWLKEADLPEAADFTWPLYSITEGRSRTFMHQEGNSVTVYRLRRNNGDFIVSSGVVELTTVTSKAAERPSYEDSENDELWKLIDSNSTTDED